VTAVTHAGVAHCIGCGCHDLHACEGGCWWLEVDYAAAAGVCSECKNHLPSWQAGQRSGPGLTRHYDAFKQIVRSHLGGKLPAEEWTRLRALAGRPGPQPALPATTDAGPEELIDAAMSEDGMPMSELLNAWGESADMIGQLDGHPVYYFRGRGIYAWSVSPDAPSMLSVWVTHPAYPPGW